MARSLALVYESSAFIHNVSFHQFADDTQLYIGLNPKTPEDSLGVLNQFSTDVLSWFTNNGLSLKPTKTEVLFLGTRPSVSSVDSDSKIHIAGCSIEPTNSLKSLGVILDNSLSFDKHTDMVCEICYFHIRALRHIRNTLSLDMAKTIAVAITGSRIDYLQFRSLRYFYQEHTQTAESSKHTGSRCDHPSKV